MFFFISIYLFSLAAFLIHWKKLLPEQKNAGKCIELLLLYQIVFSLGITSLVAFGALSLMKEYIATYTGWPACPFEQQLANVNLAFGVLGILSIWLRGLFWVATVLGFSIWILSDGFHHLYEYHVLNNFSEGNVGVPLWTDFLVPMVLLILLYLYLRGRNWTDLSFVPERKDSGRS
jgi:hypothetical protein